MTPAELRALAKTAEDLAECDCDLDTVEFPGTLCIHGDAWRALEDAGFNSSEEGYTLARAFAGLMEAVAHMAACHEGYCYHDELGPAALRAAEEALKGGEG